MSSIDNRIVQMEFNNSQFERGVATTMESLQGLDHQINSMSKNGILDGLASGVDAVAERFSTLGVVGMSIIENLTDRIVNMGISLTKSMTVDQITAGMSKYEAITTATMAIVNQADISYEKAGEFIDTLAWYSDVTSFDLNSMVSALKTFASQGIALEEAIPVIMGIGNSVTYAGQSAKEGSAAFDAYAKAISTGYLDNRAWITLNRGLGVTTLKLKEQLIESAVAMGTLQKTGEGTWKTNAGLEVTLENLQTTLGHVDGKWATTAVIMDLFGKRYGSFTQRVQELVAQHKEETGYTLTLNEAYTKFSDTLKKEVGPEIYELGKTYLDSATKARTLTEAIDAIKDAASTQFANIFTSIFGTPEEAIEMWTAFSDALNSILVTPINNLSNALAAWHEMGGRTNLFDAIGELYTGLAGNEEEGIIGFVEQFGESLDKVFPPLTGIGILNFTSGLAENLNDLHMIFSSFPITEKIEELWDLINSQNESEGGMLKDLDWAFEEIDKYEKLLSIRERFTDVINGAIDAVAILKDMVSQLIDPFKQLKEPIAYFADGMLTIAAHFGRYISGAKESGEVTEWFGEMLKPLDTALGYVAKGIRTITDLLVKIGTNGYVEKIISWIGRFTRSILDSFPSVISTLSAFFKELSPIKDIFSFFAVIVQKVISGIHSLGQALSESLGKVFGEGIGGNWAARLVVIALALRKFLDFKYFKEGLSKFTELANTIKEFLGSIGEAIESFVAANRSKQLKEIAGSLLLLAASLWIVASINDTALMTAAGTLIGVALLLVKMMDVLSKIPSLKKMDSAFNIATLLSLSTSVLILAGAMKMLAGIGDNYNAAAIGLSAVSVLLWELVGVLAVTSKFDPKKISGLMGLATAVVILTAAVKILGTTDVGVLLRGGTAISGILLAFVLFSAAMSSIDTTGFLATGAALVLIATALTVMMAPILVMSLIPWDNLWQGLGSLAILLAEISLFGAAMSKKAVQMTILGAALIEMSAAFMIMAGALSVLAMLGWDGLSVGLVGLTLVLAELGVFTYLVGGLGPMMIVAGAGIAAMGAGLVVMSVALAALAAIGLKGIGAAILGVAGALISFAGVSLVLTALWPVMLIGAGVITALSAALIVLGAALTKIAAAVLIFKLAFSDGSTSVQNDARTTSNAIQQTNDEIEKSIQHTTDGVYGTVSTSSDKTYNYITGTLGQTASATGNFGDTLRQLTSSTGGDITGIVSNTGLDIQNLVDGTGSDLTQTIKDTGLDLNTESLGIGNTMTVSWKSIGSMLIEGLKNGIKAKFQSALDAIANFGNRMAETYQGTLGIYSPSRVFMRFGEYMDEGLIVGIQNYANKVEGTTEDLGNSVIKSFSGPMAQVASLAESDLSISPKITPVIDASNIQNGQKYLDSLFASRNISASISGAANANLLAIGSIGTKIADLEAQIARMSSSQLNETTLATALANAMRNVDLYMDGSKVGRMVTNYQSSSNRAAGR